MVDPADGLATVGFGTGASGRVFALARYLSTGVEDPAFGSGSGRVVEDFLSSADEEYAAVAYQNLAATDYLVAAGYVSTPGRMAVARYTATGVRDLSFGDAAAVDGYELIDSPTLRDERATDIGLDSLGRIVVAGHGWFDLLTAYGRPVVARLDENGNPDPSCGQNGVFEWLQLFPSDGGGAANLTSNVVVRGLAIDPATDDIYLIGQLHLLSSVRSIWVGKIRAEDCTPDLAFGGSGTGFAVLPGSAMTGETGHSWANGGVFDGEGRLLLAATATAFDTERGLHAGRIVVAALGPTGALDTSFGFMTGYALLGTTARWHESAYGIQLRPEPGSILVVGRSYEHVDDDDVNQAVLYQVDLNGLTWFRSPGDLPGPDEWATDLAVRSDGDVVISARTMVP